MQTVLNPYNGNLQLVDKMNIGDPIIGGSAGSVLFIDASGNLGEDNVNFVWDDTNNVLQLSGNAQMQTWSNGTGTVNLYQTGNISYLGTVSATGIGLGTGNAWPSLYVHFVSQNDMVALGNSAHALSPNAQIHQFIPNAARIGHIIKAAAAQSANLFELQDSNGVILSLFDFEGKLGVGAISSLAAVNIDAMDTAESHLRFSGTKSPTSGNPIMVRVENAYDPQGALGTLTIVNNSCSISGSDSNNISTVLGSFTRLNVIGSYGGTITNFRGAQFNDAKITSSGSPTITNQVAIVVNALSSGANANRGIDLLIPSSSPGAFNIFASGTAPNYFVGNIGFNDFSPDAKIDIDLNVATDIGIIIEAHASPTANLKEYRESGGSTPATGTNAAGRFGRQAISIKSGDYTLTVSDSVVVFTATATATLPAATGTGQTYRIVCRAGTTTIDGNGSDTVKGSTTETLSSGEDLIITDTATGIWE